MPRRTDLEKEAALAYARVFSEEDLNAIAAFYNSEAGKKLLSDGPIVTRELFKAADIWQRGVARDLAQSVGAKLAAGGQEPGAPIRQRRRRAPRPATDPAAPADPAVAPAQ